MSIETIISNKAGFYFKDNNLKDKYPKIYNDIINHCNEMDDLNIREMSYLYYHNISERPICSTCSKSTKIKGTFNKGFSKYCTVTCMNRNSDRKKDIIKSNIKLYGVESHNSIESVKNKKKITSLENYGFETPMKSKEVLSKIKNTLMNRYGVDTPMKIPSVIENRNNLILELKEKNIERLVDRISTDEYKITSKSSNGYKMLHYDCNNTFEIDSNLLCSRLYYNSRLCTICNKVNSKSEKHNQINEFLSELSITNIIENDRKLLNNKELDFYLPDHKLAIEFNGLYWHSDKFKSNNYHLNKTELALKNNISLIHIFEDEWINNPDIVKSIIKSKLGLLSNKIYARKSIIKEVSSKESKVFLDNNHIQGNVNSSIRIGLYYENELVSLMTFGKKRASMGSKSEDGHYEMYRFCNKLDTSVVGGGSKLFKYFITNYTSKEVISYADRRYFTGEMYEKLGFKLDGISKPNYWYTYAGKREYRFGFRKDVLVKEGFDENKSEREIMIERGYLRIYDCGNLKYKYTI
jgi:hypothetical protein